MKNDSRLPGPEPSRDGEADEAAAPLPNSRARKPRAERRERSEGQAGIAAAAGKPVTAAYLERAATYYLARFSSSSENLRRVLARKARRRAGAEAEPGPEVAAMIAEVVDKAVRSGLIDDASYAGSKLNALLRRGASTRSARATLAAKGLGPETVAAALAENEPDETAQARRYAQRRGLGPWRRNPDPPRHERDIAALCRAGFSYRVAAEVLAAKPADEEESAAGPP
jgi:regulatory protein